MLKAFARFLGLDRGSKTEPAEKKKLTGASVSLDFRLQSKNIFVRIVHAGGREELYKSAVPASELMEKYPGMCVARPGVFRNPHRCLLWPDDRLLPGNKYLMLPTTTARKLTRNYSRKLKAKGSAEDVNITWDAKQDVSVESVCSARDFYASKEQEPKASARKSSRTRKPFVPPLPRTRSARGLTWEPSLTSVQELSP